MTATEKYVETLSRLKEGDLGLLRTHTDQGLDETLSGFDLFAGLWWPLREKSQRAPRREVAWTIAKLYAACPIEHQADATLARQLRRCRPHEESARKRHEQRIDRLLMLPLDKLEPALRWALGLVASNDLKVDWVKLTNDLSRWERERVRLKWAEEYLNAEERG